MVDQWDPEWVCPECGMKREVECGPDPCIGLLPGVDFACCGHGGRRTQSGSGYIKFTNGTIIRFDKLTAIEGR